MALMVRIFKITAIFVIAVILGSAPGPAFADRTSLIRDTEIENTIREFATPVFRAAELNSSSVKLYLIQDNSINAFVAGGQRLFIHTGLLMRATNAGQVIGVIAHETGHIAGGHLIRGNEALEHATVASLMSLLVGGIAIGAGRGDIGNAVISAGQSTSVRGLLHFSRTQESSADQAGLKFLDSAGFSATGLMEFMKILGDQESLLPEQQDPYAQTHPLTRDRIIAVENHVAHAPTSKNSLPPEFEVKFQRMKAKLFGFLNSYGHVIRVYRESDNSVQSRYARAVASFRRPDMPTALGLIDGLIAEMPDDPYFWELKGQMLFENGNAKEALEPYQKAVRLLPNAELLRTDLARVQLALNDDTLLESAIENLRYALARERNSPFIWRQLAIAYGRKGDKGHGSLAIAEEALLIGRKADARYHAGYAGRVFKTGTREWLQAQDILVAAQEKRNK